MLFIVVVLILIPLACLLYCIVYLFIPTHGPHCIALFHYLPITSSCPRLFAGKTHIILFTNFLTPFTHLLRALHSIPFYYHFHFALLYSLYLAFTLPCLTLFIYLFIPSHICISHIFVPIHIASCLHYLTFIVIYLVMCNSIHCCYLFLALKFTLSTPTPTHLFPSAFVPLRYTSHFPHIAFVVVGFWFLPHIPLDSFTFSLHSSHCRLLVTRLFTHTHTHTDLLTLVCVPHLVPFPYSSLRLVCGSGRLLDSRLFCLPQLLLWHYNLTYIWHLWPCPTGCTLHLVLVPCLLYLPGWFTFTTTVGSLLLFVTLHLPFIPTRLCCTFCVFLLLLLALLGNLQHLLVHLTPHIYLHCLFIVVDIVFVLLFWHLFSLDLCCCWFIWLFVVIYLLLLCIYTVGSEIYVALLFPHVVDLLFPRRCSLWSHVFHWFLPHLLHTHRFQVGCLHDFGPLRCWATLVFTTLLHSLRLFRWTGLRFMLFTHTFAFTLLPRVWTFTTLRLIPKEKKERKGRKKFYQLFYSEFIQIDLLIERREEGKRCYSVILHSPFGVVPYWFYLHLLFIPSASSILLLFLLFVVVHSVG